MIFVNFVLDVLGSAGAVWGFSEILLFRTDETIGIWRPVAVAVGAVFTLRWMYQLYVFAFPLSVDQSPSRDIAQTRLRTARFMTTTTTEIQADASSNVELTNQYDQHELSLAETNEEV
jgi:hypothetical protein